MERAGVGNGSTLLIHSGVAGLIAEDSREGVSPLQYARKFVDMLMELVGTEGTLVMSTDSIGNPREFAYNERVFNPDLMPSRRGTITEVFRQRPDVLRSRHPWCNASAWGAHAEWLIEDHLQSTPFAMDRNSPWFKLTELDTTIAYIGVQPRTANLCIVLPEHLLGLDYPVGAFFDKPVLLKYTTSAGDVAQIPVFLNVHDWTKADVQRFLDHLDRTYALHSRYGTGASRITVCKAKEQLDALMAELARGHFYPHSRYWL